MTGNSRVDLKVVLLGREYVGKTALVERFLHERFLSNHAYQSTIGAAYGSKRINTSDNQEIVLGVWDTAGSERYESMARIYYRGAGAAVICYDVTDAASLERAKFWTRELQKYEEACRIYFCGCKRDLVKEDPSARQVGEAEVEDFASSVGARWTETSSRTGENIERLFRWIANDFACEPSLTSTLAADGSSSRSFALRRDQAAAASAGGAAGQRRTSRCSC